MASETALVIVLLSLALLLAWTVWYCVGHTARANRELIAATRELGGHLWSIRAVEDPRTAQSALQLEAMRAAAQSHTVPQVPSRWPDEEELQRS